MNDSDSFRRGQIEWALCRMLTAGRRISPGPPTVFLTRIKRLLELDRTTESDAECFAFHNEAPEGKGTDSSYTGFNAFCLGLALEMLDAGFKQSEIVFFLQHTRGDLERHYRKILRSPPSVRQRLAAEDRPNCPTYEEDGVQWADPRVFMVTNKIEMTEILPAAKQRLGKSPVISKPHFLHGIEALRGELHRLSFSQRKTFVLEVAYLAVMINEYLAQAPDIHRGRS